VDAEEVKRLAVALAIVASSSCPRTTRPAGASKAVLFVTAQLEGSIAPCGCSEAMRGGLSRTASVINGARGTGVPVFYVDSGDALFASGSITEDAVAQQERKARALSDGMKAMGLSIRIPGPRDDVRGADFHRSLALPELAVGSVHWLDVAGRPVAIVAGNDLKSVESLAAQSRERAVFIVAFVAQPLNLLQAEQPAASIDLVISTKARDVLSAEENKRVGVSPKLVALQTRGRSILRVDLNVVTDGRAEWVSGLGERDRELSALDTRVELLRAQLDEPGISEELKALKAAKLDEVIARRKTLAETPLAMPPDKNSVSLTFVPIEPSLAIDPKVAAIETKYDEDVGLLNLAWAKAHPEACPPPDADRSGYVGNSACLGCHPAAMAVWSTTKHPHAYEALEAKKKQYHLDCIGCHVTGWRQAGGVCRIDDVEGRDHVGCEACHGPGWKHTQMPEKQYIVLGNDEKQCVGCHDAENSPHFDFERYRAKVLGPGHGQPLADGGWGLRGGRETGR
jgi:hypothetical protein